ncbi:hypothetical protein [Flavobacterium panici]|uniref:Uncharacterized protein n=1 Tax=Flavobacterium panici TaxID=2654843 RepID=A0A9N8J2J9_9FLAO|nr:hypothetical protein [Flavobacterium panici]CAC9974351.1 hypothetical protein FLAPXU55_02048 [Flavobacterium panici]
MTQTDKIRIKVLNYSLSLEKVASYILGFILDIEDVNLSKSFGNTSNSLSFNQKVNLLLDYGAIEKNDKIKLDLAMSIRNQFMHNLKCETYQYAFNCLDGAENKIKNLYPDLFANEDNEINLEECTEKIFTDSFVILGSMKGGVERKIELLSSSSFNKKLVDSFKNNSKEKFEELLTEILNKELNFQNEEILVNRITKLFTEILVGSVEKISKTKEPLQ